MGSPVRLFKCAARALVRSAVNLVSFGVGGDIVFDIWDSWHKASGEEQRHDELQALAVADAASVKAAAEEAVREEAGELPPEQQQLVTAYLQQVPAMVRRSLRRPSDPGGTTVPAGLVLRRAEDLLPLLPPRMPRFKAGDRPLPGVDWELVELLGVGGFGEVWKARNPFFDGVAPVALKFCLDPAARERLLKHEAAVLNRVMRQGRHDGIIPLQHTYLSADPPCLEYEFVEGGDLAGLLREGRPSGGGLPPPQAAQVVQRLAQIVGFAHRLEPPIVHRDLKPANILVQRGATGQPVFRVGDFGIGGLATRHAIETARSASRPDDYLVSAVRGAYTPLYASPQQMRGDPADPRDDVYALGIIWHQLLTGDLTRGCPTGRGWQKRLREQGMSEPLLNLLMDCFGDEPEDRPASAFVLADELGRLLGAKPPASEPRASASGPAAPLADALSSDERAAPPAGEVVLGIDLGTTSCRMAVLVGGEVRVLRRGDTDPMPSAVAFTEGKCLTGWEAVRQRGATSGRTLSSVKRLLGCRGADLEDLGSSFPSPLDRAGPADLVRVAADRPRTPQEVLAALLRRLRREAEADLGRPARRAIITVPAAYHDAQRQAVLEAARAAGFDLTWDIKDPITGKSSRVAMRLLSEPVAAAVAFTTKREAPGRLAVVNFGGGHLDVAVVDAGDGLVRVEAVAGDTRLGGDDFDRVILDWIAGEFKKEHGTDLRKDPAAVPRLREAAEGAKKELSQKTQADIVLPFIAADAGGPKHLRMTLTRAQFERMVTPLLERCRAVLARTLKEVRRGHADLSEVLLVGGMTQAPCVRQLVRDVFGREGTAATEWGLAASGAAILGANLLRGSQAEVLVIDVVPLTLGIETFGGVMHPVIERNATLPVERKQLFSTAEDNQSAVTVKVFQGERPMAADNRLLGEFNLGGIGRAPRGVPQIEVSLSLDANGMLKVSARDLGTGKENTIGIEGSSRLPEAEIDRMRREVERLVD